MCLHLQEAFVYRLLQLTMQCVSSNKNTCSLIFTGSLMKVSLGSLPTCRLPLKNPGHTELSATGFHLADCALTDTTEDTHDDRVRTGFKAFKSIKQASKMQDLFYSHCFSSAKCPCYYYGFHVSRFDLIF